MFQRRREEIWLWELSWGVLQGKQSAHVIYREITGHRLSKNKTIMVYKAT